MSYSYLKEIASKAGIRVIDLLALARQHDPFYVGSEPSLRKAQWFKKLWQDFGYKQAWESEQRKSHFRRIHYVVQAEGNYPLPGGEIYQNLDTHWDYLEMASKYARELMLVDPEAFVDRRNPEPHLYLYPRNLDQPAWAPTTGWYSLPSINTALNWDLDLRLPEPVVTGYDYDGSLQPYHLEIWVEKSTMDDILLPLGHEHQVNVVTGLGYMSITSVIRLIKRIGGMGKPAIILYISDFDPGGTGMPTQVARHIEYWIKVYSTKEHIRLTPIALTKGQVIDYQLPRTPIKETDTRKDAFEKRFGEGAVELDALEALHPGELERLVEEAIGEFQDEDLEDRIAEAKNKAQESLDSLWRQEILPYQAELDEISEQAKGILSNYEERLDEVSDELDEELQPLEERLDRVRQAVYNKIASLTVDLPPLPEPWVFENDRWWLFDSKREYIDQMRNYKRWKNGNLGGPE